MKKIKIILLKSTFLLVAFQMLNLSIDFDHVRRDTYSSAGEDNFDDIDSYSEYIIEEIAGDDHYTSENDNDSGQDKGVEKTAVIVMYCESFSKNLPAVSTMVTSHSSWATGLDLANKTCKGYLQIISPPPEA